MASCLPAILAALAAIFLAQEHTSARLFTAECFKNENDQFLCAATAPDAEVGPAAGMSGHVGCTMSCTLDERCVQFNHVPAAALPCQLFYTPPTTFMHTEGCEHYRSTSAAAAGALTKFTPQRLCDEIQAFTSFFVS